MTTNNSNNRLAPDYWMDEVLTVLAAQPIITGEVRKSHRLGWVSALHVLTELVINESIADVQTGSPHHTQYRYVAFAIIELEDAKIIRVTRAHGSASRKANNVERIEVL